VPEKHERRGPGGRPRNEALTGTRRARGRTLADAPKTRGEQTIALMREADLEFGIKLAIFNGEREPLTPSEACIMAVAHRYVVSHGYGKANTPAHPQRGEVPFTAAELDAIRAGTFVMPVTGTQTASEPR